MQHRKKKSNEKINLNERKQASSSCQPVTAAGDVAEELAQRANAAASTLKASQTAYPLLLIKIKKPKRHKGNSMLHHLPWNTL